MLQIKLTDPVPSVEDTISILSVQNDRFGIPMDYDRILEYYGYYSMMSRELKIKVSKYIGEPSLAENIKDSDFLKFLKAASVSTGLLLTDQGRVSLSSASLKSVIDTGLYSIELCQLLQMYMDAKSYAQKVCMFPNIIKSYIPNTWSTYDGHRLIMVNPRWVSQNTGRLGMQEPAAINIAKDLADVFTVPKGWRYLEADSGQIEPRIIQSHILRDPQLMKCTLMYQDAYFGYVHYCTILTEEQRRTGTLDIQPVELSDAIIAKRKKFKTYGNAVMYGSTENASQDPDKDAFIRYIGGHPNRLKLQQKIEEQIDRGERVFNTAFGTPINITMGPSEGSYEDKTAKAYFRHLVRCAINNPVQGTAADLMRMSIRQAMRILDRGSASFIIKYTHDSGTFALHEAEYDRLIDELREVTSYQVEDWLPIYNDPVEEIENKSGLKRLIK